MREDIIAMTKRELERYQVITRCLRKELRQATAGELLGLSVRQIRRLVKQVRTSGMRGLKHGNRGRESPRKMGPELEQKIASIIAERYPDFTPLHAAEKLWERHRIRVSRERVRQLMMARGLWKRRWRRKAERLRRTWAVSNSRSFRRRARGSAAFVCISARWTTSSSSSGFRWRRGSSWTTVNLRI